MSYPNIEKHGIGPAELSKKFLFDTIKDFFFSEDYLWLMETFDKAIGIKEKHPESCSVQEFELMDWISKKRMQKYILKDLKPTNQ